MRGFAALAVVGLALAGCGRVDEDSTPSTTAAPVAPTDPPVELTATSTPETSLLPATSEPPETSAPKTSAPETSQPPETSAPETSEPAERSGTPAAATRSPPTIPPTDAPAPAVARPTSPRPTSTTSSSTTSSSTTTTITLPVPIEPPAENGTRDPEMVLGRLEIPAIELDSELQEGIRIPTLDDGPGHWPGTAMPGELGNTVVAGHRTSSGAEFRRLDELVEGDEVIMTTPHGRFVYLVEAIEIVTPDAMWIVTQTRDHTATLFACHPPGSVAERIVAHLRLADA